MTNVEKTDLWIFTIWVQALIFNGNNLIDLLKRCSKISQLASHEVLQLPFSFHNKKKAETKEKKVEKLKFHDQVTEKRRDI